MILSGNSAKLRIYRKFSDGDFTFKIKFLIKVSPKLGMADIVFPTELYLKNVNYLYSACSNPTNVVLVIVLSMIISKGLDNGNAKFNRCVITQAVTKTIT